MIVALGGLWICRTSRAKRSRYTGRGMEKTVGSGGTGLENFFDKGGLSVLVFNLLSVGYLTLIHTQRKSAFGIGTDPSFEQHGRSILAVI